MSEFSEHVRTGIVMVTCGRQMGTGWVVAHHDTYECCMVVTAKHVVEDHAASGADIRFQREGLNHPIPCDNYRVKTSPVVDLAIIEVEGNLDDIGALNVVSRDGAFERGKIVVQRIGTPVFMGGYSETANLYFGKPTFVVSQGLVATTGHDPTGQPVCLVDGHVNRGMSGGPVWIGQEDVLGMILAYCGPQTTPNLAWPGLGVLLPIGHVESFIRSNFQVQFHP